MQSSNLIAQNRVQQEILAHHPELKIRVSQTTQDIFTDNEEELAPVNILEGNVVPMFLTVAAEETEPLELKTLRQARTIPAGLNGKTQ